MTKIEPHFKNSQRFKYKGKTYAYTTIHNWLHRHYGRATLCENKECPKKSKNYEWANISGKYKRDRRDWEQLCVSCHRIKDFTDIQRERISEAKRGIDGAGKLVHQYSLTGELIAKYKSVRQATRETNILNTAIYNNISGRSSNSGGYIWSYKEL